jgi:hypothetical protein
MYVIYFLTWEEPIPNNKLSYSGAVEVLERDIFLTNFENKQKINYCTAIIFTFYTKTVKTTLGGNKVQMHLYFNIILI